MRTGESLTGNVKAGRVKYVHGTQFLELQAGRFLSQFHLLATACKSFTVGEDNRYIFLGEFPGNFFAFHFNTLNG